jgi:hypothetical protein
MLLREFGSSRAHRKIRHAWNKLNSNLESSNNMYIHIHICFIFCMRNTHMQRNMSISVGNGVSPATSGGGGSQPQRLLAAPFLTRIYEHFVGSKYHWKYFRFFVSPSRARWSWPRGNRGTWEFVKKSAHTALLEGVVKDWKKCLES